MARRLQSINEKKEFDWKGSITALKYIPRFFGEVKKSGPLLYYINTGGRIFNSLTPIVLLWVGKLIIDEIILLANGGNTGDSKIWWLVGIELSVAIFSDLLNRMVTLTDGLIGDLYSNMS